VTNQWQSDKAVNCIWQSIQCCLRYRTDTMLVLEDSELQLVWLADGAVGLRPPAFAAAGRRGVDEVLPKPLSPSRTFTECCWLLPT